MTSTDRFSLGRLVGTALSMPWAAWLILLASAGSLAIAFIAQYGFGLQPCILCLMQRIPFALAIVLAGLALGLRPYGQRTRVLLWLCAAVFLLGAGIAFFHTGVEQHWWMGTEGCAVSSLDGADAARRREQLLNKMVARCDVITWTVLGVSMTTWNVPFSLALAGFAGWAARKRS